MSDDNLYKIIAKPHEQTVTPGAKVTYTCAQTYATISSMDGPRDFCRWFWVRDRESIKHWWQRAIVPGPYEFAWPDFVWDVIGKHTIQAIMRFADGDLVCYEYPQWVEPMNDVIGRALFKARKSAAPDPTEAFNDLTRYIKIIKDIARAIPPQGDENKKKHEDTLKAYETYRDKFEERLASTRETLRIPFHAVHKEKESQKESKLQVFLACIKAGDGKQTWTLVDWTNPAVREMTGEYTRSGATAKEAINACISAWNSGNRYPDGKIAWTIAKRVVGEDLNGDFETNGASFWDSVAKFFEYVALGAAVVAGIVTLVAPVPGSQIVSAAIWTCIFSSTAAAVINIGQRHEEGFGSWKDDAFDGLTIVSNLFAGAGMWVRGASVIAKNSAGKVVKYVLIGQITTDSVQGVLVAADHFGQLEDILNNKSLTPDERAKRLLDLFKSFALAGTMTYLAIKGTKADLDHIGTTNKHLPSDQGKPPSEKLRELKDPAAVVDTTKPVNMEGHTKDGEQTTTHHTEQKRVHVEEPPPKSSVKKPPKPNNRGMSDTHDAVFASRAKEDGVIIVVRDSNPDAVKFIGQDGYAPKPESVKAKTIKDKSNSNCGLAAANPNDAKLKELLDAWETKVPEKAPSDPWEQKWVAEHGGKQGISYTDYVEYMEHHGYTIGGPPDHLVIETATGNKFYSDYDLHGMYKEGGQNMDTPAYRAKINDSLGDEMVMHGAHDNWGAKETSGAGPNRGPQPPCTAYLPDGTQVHLETIADMAAFYKQHGISWEQIYKDHARYNPEYGKPGVKQNKLD